MDVELSAPGKVPTQAKIRQYLAAVNKVTLLLQKYGDSASIAKMELARERISGIAESIGLDETGENSKSESRRPPSDYKLALTMILAELPPALRSALMHLASEERVVQLWTALVEAVRAMTPDGDEDMPPLDFSDENIPIEWEEGTEDLNGRSMEELWQDLGLSEQRLPFFNIKQDPTGVRDPWNAVDQEWYAIPTNGVLFGPHWHQLVGILRMLERFFKGDSTLLMDEVGLGKTIQVVGLIVMVAYFREYFIIHNRFPGKFGTSSFA